MGCFLSVFMNRFSHNFLIVFSGWLTICHAAVPPGFEDLFSPHLKAIDVKIAGRQTSVTAAALVTYDQFRLDSEHSQTIVESYLDQSHLAIDTIKVVMSQLNQGVGTDSSCFSSAQVCVVNTHAGKVKYAFDYDAALLRLFVAPSDIVQQRTSDVTFHSSYNPNSSLISSFQLTSFSDLKQQDKTTLDNQSLLGIGHGSVFFDTQYDVNDQQLATYSALYDLHVDGYQMQIGQHRYNLEFNSLDFLHRNANYSGVSAAFGSSKTLLVGGERSHRQLSFYVPQTGLLQLYRGDRLLDSFPVESGLQQVRYADLPTGTYQLTMKLWVSGQEVFNEQRNIVNNSEYTLNRGEFDFRFGAGWLEEQWLESNQASNAALPYLTAGASSLVQEPLLLATMVSSSPQGHAFHLGGQWVLGESASLDYNVAFSERGEHYQQANFSWGPLFLNGLINQAEFHRQASLMDTLYGEDDYQEFNGGWMGSLLFGQSFVRFYQRKQNSENHQLESKQSGVSVGWSKQYQRHSIDLSADVVEHPETEMNFRVTWRVQLSDRFSVVALGFGQDGELTNGKIGLNHQWSDAQWQFNNDVTWQRSLAQHGESQWDSSHSVNIKNDALRGSGYGYFSNSGQKNVSGSISSTLLVNRTGVSATSQKSDAYLRLHSESESQVDVYLLDEADRSQRHLIEGQSLNLPLNSYQMAKLQLDGRRTNTLVDETHRNQFVHKGGIWDVEVEAEPLASQLIIVEQTFGRSLDCENAECRIEPVTNDGVYRVNAAHGKIEDITILSAGHPCPLVTHRKTDQPKTFVCQ